MMASKKNKHGTSSKKNPVSMSEAQKCLMLDFIATHPCIIKSRPVRRAGNNSTENRQDWYQLWDDLADVLNKCQPGPKKDAAGWRRSWHDMKRYEIMKAVGSMTEASHSKDATSQPKTLLLSPLQEKISNLLGEALTEELRDGIKDSLADAIQNKESITDSLSGDKHSKERAHSSIDDAEKEEANDKSSHFAKKETGIASALKNIADAMTERNLIEKRKTEVFEKFLQICAFKFGVSAEDQDADSDAC